MPWVWSHAERGLVGVWRPAWQVQAGFFEDEAGTPLVRVKLLQGGVLRHQCVIPHLPEQPLMVLMERLTIIADRFRDPVGSILRARGSAAANSNRRNT